MRMKESHLARSMLESHVGAERMLGRSASAATDLLLSLNFTTTSQPAALDSYARASVCAPVTGLDSGGGVVVTKFASGEYAYAHDANFSHSSVAITGKTNLVPDSTNFDSVSATSLTSGETDPDGGTDAWNVVETAADGRGAACEEATCDNGQNYTFSCYVRSNTGSNQGFGFRVTEPGVGNLVTNSETATTSWQRFSATVTPTNGAPHELRIIRDGGSNIDLLIAFPQIEAASSATTYQGTDGTSLVYTDHDGKLGMLLEPAATNNIKDSEYAEPSGIATVTANYGAAPDGTATSYRVETAAASGRGARTTTHATTNTQQYTLSVFAKAAGSAQEVTLNHDSAPAASSAFDVTTEWQRYTFTFTADATTSVARAFIECTGTDALDLEVWGWQLETGAVASSYLPTSGATAARVKTTNKVSNAYSSGYVQHDTGEIAMTFISNQWPANAYLWDVSTATGSAGGDRKLGFSSDGTSTDSRTYNSVGAGAGLAARAQLTYTISDAAEISYRFWWDFSTGATVEIDGPANTDTDPVPHTPGTANTDIFLGQNYSDASQAVMVLAFFTIYSVEQV